MEHIEQLDAALTANIEKDKAIKDLSAYHQWCEDTGKPKNAKQWELWKTWYRAMIIMGNMVKNGTKSHEL